MTAKKNHSFNYYFLNKYITLEKPEGYRQTVITLLVNENDSKNRGKFLFVQENGGTWGLSRHGVVAQDLVENLFETLIQNLGEELGFRGVKVFEAKPNFKQIAYLFNIERQTYDETRSKAEVAKKRPTKGKLYHLAIMSYKGPNDLPININESKSIIRDYRWVNEKEARELSEKNHVIIKGRLDFSQKSMEFQDKFLDRIISINTHINEIYLNNLSGQKPLFYGAF